MAQSLDFAIPPLSPSEQDRGLKALAELERLDRELLKKRSGKPFPSSSEILNQDRDERTRGLIDRS